MADNQDDSFEVDGVAVDYAGPEEAFDEDLVTDEEGGDDDGLVIDSVGLNDDLGGFRQMKPNVGADSVGDVEVDFAKNNKFKDERRNAEVSSQSPVVKKNLNDKNNGDNDDEPYLEIMVSEQEFDDVGEIDGEAVSRGEADFSREEPASKSKASASKEKKKDATASQNTSFPAGPTSSTAGFTSLRKSERTRGRTDVSSSDNQVTSSAKSIGESGGSKTKTAKATEKKESERSPSSKSKAKSTASSSTAAPSSQSKLEEKKTLSTEEKLPSPEVTAQPSLVEKDDEKSTQQDTSVKAESPEIEAPASNGNDSLAKTTSIALSGGDQGGLVVSIRNLAEKTTANVLKEKLAEIAPVLSCTIFLRKKDERYALAKFRTIEDCNACVDKFNNVELDGCVLTVALAPKRKLPVTSGKSDSLTKGVGGDRKRRNGEDKSDGRRVVRTTRSGDGSTKKADEKTKRNDDQSDGKNGEKSTEGGRTRPLRLRSPIRPPARSPKRTTRPTSSTDRPRRPARGTSPVRQKSKDLEIQRQRNEFEERRRVLEWKRSQQERMRREEDLMKRKADVEALRLDRERARLKLERERLEAERLQLERQKNRDRELLERERKRREEDERRQRLEREREREKEHERERFRRVGEKRPLRDSDRDSDRVVKRRSPEPISRGRVINDRDRDNRPVARHGDRGYDRPRAVSPRALARRASPVRRGSPIRSNKPDRYLTSNTRITTFDHNRRSHDNDRGIGGSGDAARRFQDFRVERGAQEFGSRRQESRGDHWNGNSNSYSGGNSATMGGPTSWSSPVVPASVNASGSHVFTAPNHAYVSGGQSSQYIDRYSSTNPTPAIRGQRY